MKTKLRKIEHVCGVEYISERTENKSFVIFLLILFTFYFTHFVQKTYSLGVLNINEVQILLFIIYLSLFILYLDNHFVEKLVLIYNVGIQIEKNSLFNKGIRFICVDDLKSVFIHEVIYIFEICPYLCISLKDNQLIVVFENFSLEMRKLVNIYREIKKMFFFGQIKLLENIKYMKINCDCPDFCEDDSFFNTNEEFCEGYSSDDELNIFQMLASTYNEQLKGSCEDLKKEIIYDVYINKKVALEIMNK